MSGSDRGSIDNWRRDRENQPARYDRDVISPEFRDRPPPPAASISSSRRAPSVAISDDDRPSVAASQSTRPRRKSILVDPEERARRPKAERRNSQVRLQPSDDSDDDYLRSQRSRRGEASIDDRLPKPPISGDTSRRAPTDSGSRRSRHDLENKTDMASQRFRERRDGYESDEGDTLKDDRRGGRDYRPDDARPRERRRGADPDDGEGSGSGARNGGGKSRRPADDGYDPRDPRDVEPRGDPRGGDPRPRRDMPDRTRAPPVQYGTDPLGPSGRGADYDDDPRGAPPRRTASQRERRPPRGYAPADYDDDDDDYRAPPRRHASQRDPRREGRRPPPAAYDDEYDGYKSDRNGRRSGGPRYDDYYSDGNHARGGNRPPAYYDDLDRDRPRRRDPRDDPRDHRDPRDDPYARDPRDRRSGDPRRGGGGGGRYRDEYDDYDRRGARGGGDRRGDPRDGGKKKGNGDIMAALGPAFTAYAMPMIKKEGGKFLRKQMQDLMAKQGR